MIITIPIKPANLKYLQVKYGFRAVYVVSRHHALDHLLQELMKPKPRTYSPMPLVQCTIDIQLGKDKAYSHLIHLSDEAIACFNQCVDELMRVDFVSHVYALTEYARFDINESIYHFMEKYEFQDHEITFESLLRYYHRYRNREESKLITS